MNIRVSVQGDRWIVVDANLDGCDTVSLNM
jgi:hypothetical protein